MKFFACLWLLAASLTAQERYPVDWNKLAPEMLAALHRAAAHR